MPDLRVDWCSHEAAAYAVSRWHYSRSMPASKNARLGVWESGAFIGAVLFAWGANPNLGRHFGLAMLEVAELVRVALREQQSPVSQILAVAVRMLRRQSPGLRLVLPAGAVKVRSPVKHRYAMALDDEIRARIAPLARPYPKRADHG